MALRPENPKRRKKTRAPLDRGPSQPGNRALHGNERAARLKADRMLNLLVPQAVARLRGILTSKRSTNMDLIAASREVLDRKIPKVSVTTSLGATGPMVVVLPPNPDAKPDTIPGLGWPARLPGSAHEAADLSPDHQNGHSNGGGSAH